MTNNPSVLTTASEAAASKVFKFLKPLPFIHMCCGCDAALRGKREANQGTRNQRSRTFQKQPLNLFSMWCTLCSFARNAAGELIQFHRKKRKKNGIRLTPCLCQFLVCAWDINPAGAHRLPYLKQDGKRFYIILQ